VRCGTGHQKVSTQSATLTVYKLKVFHEEKVMTQFIISRYRDNTCGTEGGTTLTLFRNIINTKNIDCSSAGTAVPPNVYTPDDGRVGQAM
jgi:hypothetical protein